MTSLNVASPSKGKMLEDYIADNLPRFFPGIRVESRNERVANGGRFDIHAKDSKGIDYYIEVKESRCNRISIGQIVEYKANLYKVNPGARIILICRDIDPRLRETLKKIDVDVETFADLKIPENIAKPQASKAGVMKLSPVEQDAYFALLRRGFMIAKAENLTSTLDISHVRAKNILSKLARDGAAQRVGKGKYVIIPADVLYSRKSYVADPLVLVSKLMKGSDYYVAYYSAAHIHGIAEQIPFKTTVAVLRQLRPIETGNVHVNFVNLKKSRFFGYEETKYMDVGLNVSDLEKTIVDCVDRQDLCSGIAEVIRTLSKAFEAEKLNWQKLGAYVKRFDNHALAQRLGFIIELLRDRKKIQVKQTIVDELLSLTGSKVYPLDIKAPRRGEISRKWRIINNTGPLEI
jgi:predicted transcriptional regulator of viral defense system